ncbi:MAG: hypothetical protein GY808_06975, partial [Gammaproteobacteria bacterium]|nr:hypothetical protein [Gammaproteobacteria bacterium]
KLFSAQKQVWFADGKIEFDQGSLIPVGDSTLVVHTHPDTTFLIDDQPSFLPKIYSFDWNNVNITGSDAKIYFYLDESELDALDRPVPQTIEILENQDAVWVAAVTDVNIDGSTINTMLPSLDVYLYTIGLDLSSLFIVDPAPNRADVNKYDPIIINFQQEMDETSLAKENIGIHGAFSGDINFNLLFDSPTNRLYLTPQDELQSGEIITVTLTDSIKTRDSGALKNGFSWRFRTSAFRGNAQFQQKGIIHTSSGTNEYLFNDFNADQIPELIELSGNLLSIFGNSDGIYNKENSIDAGQIFSNIKLADLDADGVNEIILFNDTAVLAYSYDLSNGFVETFSKSYVNGGPLMDALIADFNNDLIPDIAILLDLGDFSQIDCYYGDNLEGYNFDLPTSVILNGPADMISSSDWNNDGLFDIISSKGSDGSNIARVFNQKTSFTSFFNALPEITTQNVVITANVWENGLFKDTDEIIVAGIGSGLNLLKLFNLDDD